MKKNIFESFMQFTKLIRKNYSYIEILLELVTVTCKICRSVDYSVQKVPFEKNPFRTLFEQSNYFFPSKFVINIKLIKKKHQNKKTHTRKISQRTRNSQFFLSSKIVSQKNKKIKFLCN